MEKQKDRKRFYDYSFLFAVLFITGFGMLMMYSASSYSAQSQLNNAQYYLHRQMIFAGGGIVLMLVVSKADYHLLRIRAVYWSLYIAAWIAIILTMLIGLSSHGSARWINVFGVRFQPSEVMKSVIIIVTAARINQLGSRLDNWYVWFFTLFWGLVPAFVTAFSNLSTAIIILGIAGIMLFVSSRHYKFFIFCGLGAVLLYVGAYPMAKLLAKAHFLQEYQLTRIFAWRDPSNYIDDTYQTIQGLYAIGSGGIFGKGLGESIQKFLIPEAQNDMIFTIICEELGLFGAVSLILIYAFIIYRLYDIARNAKDLFGSMLVIGVMVHIALQAVLNIAVATNSIPNTGITLPFVSYGGTSLVLLLLECGMCLSVSGQIEIE